MMDETKLLGLDLSVASEQVIEVLLEDASESGLFREILAANIKRPEILRLLLESPSVPQDIKEEAGRILNLPVEVSAKPVREEEFRRQSLLQKIQQLTVGERIALALRGGHEIRSILSKDPNKEVVLSVLKNPKITETEVEMLAHSRNVPDDALRFISKNRDWMKNYNVILALVNNPKTPPGIGSPLVTNLRTRDIAALERNKNVPEAVRAIAKKLLQMRKQH